MTLAGAGQCPRRVGPHSTWSPSRAPPGCVPTAPAFLDDFWRCLSVCGICDSRMQGDGDRGVATNNPLSPGAPRAYFQHPIVPVQGRRQPRNPGHPWRAPHCSNYAFLFGKCHRIALIPPTSLEKPQQRASNRIPGCEGNKDGRQELGFCWGRGVSTTVPQDSRHFSSTNIQKCGHPELPQNP